MMRERISPTMAWRATVGLALAVVLAGAVYSYWLGPDLRYYDEQDYYMLATHLAQDGMFSKDGVHPTAYRPPGWPAMLALAKGLGLDVVGIRVLNFLMLALAMVLLFRIVARLANHEAALLAVMLVIAYPVLFYTAGTLYPQIFSGLLLLCCIWVMLFVRPGTLMGFGYGLSFAAFVLVLPIMLLLSPVMLIWLWWRRHWRMPVLLALIGGMVLGVGAWSLRNTLVLGHFVPISTNSGVNLLIGNSEHAQVGLGVRTDISVYKAHAPKDEVAQNRYFTQQAMHYMLAHPAKTIRHYFAKFLNYFNYHNKLATGGEATKAKEMLMLLTYGLLLLGLLARMLMARRQKLAHEEWLLLALYVASGLAYALFFTRIRFRLPFDFLLIMLAALGWHACIQRWRERSKERGA
ncbi:MAG: hypothetical protein D6678_05105 [Zetaproteobacteria bacterium]|nr:MAG: hypothetical protein D6678_05105 [Zetaproteobacteria bacterium]